MAGILNQTKSIMDYQITENGRLQMSTGDIRIEYASLSDASIVYEKDYDKSQEISSEVVDKNNLIMFEVDTKTQSQINNEFDLDNTFSFTNSNILGQSIDLTDDDTLTFSDASTQFLETNSLGKSLSNLKLLQNKNYITDGDDSFVNTGYLNNSFNFKNIDFIKNYLTIKSYKTRFSRLPSIVNDKRFRHKNAFKKLVPVQSDNSKIYEVEEDKLTIDHIFKNFSKINYDNIIDREDLIKEVISKISNNDDILKREYVIKKKSDFDSFIFNLYEINENSDAIEKMAIIDSGKFIDNNGNFKKIYLAGKLINTKQSISELDEIYTFKEGKIKNNTPNKNFAVSAYYSFVNLFTIVVE